MTGSPQPLAFEREPGYILGRAHAHAREGRMLEALTLFRLAAERAPDRPAYRLALVRHYQDMGCHPCAQRALYPLMAAQRQVPTCFFLMGLSFYAMNDVPRARDCLWQYATLSARGKHIDEAEDVLAQIEQLSRGETRDRQQRLLQRTREAMGAQRPARAQRLLDRAIAMGPDPDLWALKAFMILHGGDPRQALALGKKAYKADPHNVRGLCVMACALFALGHQVLSTPYLKKAAAHAKYPQDAVLMCQTACQTEHHALAFELLTPMHREAPYELNVLWMLAFASYNVGQVGQASRLIARYCLLDPEDLVATWAQDVIQQALPQGEVQPPPLEPLPYRWELPSEAAVPRLTALSAAVHAGTDSLRAALSTRGDLVRTVRWGLGVEDEDQATCRTMITLLGATDCPASRQMLLECLLDPSLPENIKRQAMAALSHLGNQGPFLVALDDRYVRVMVHTAEAATLPPLAERILQAVVDRLIPRYGQAIRALSTLWLGYVASLGEGHLSRPRAWMAALELSFHITQAHAVNPQAIARAFGISQRMLVKYAGRILKTTLQEEEAHGLN